MKKMLLIVLALALVICLVAPKLIGARAKNEMDKIVDAFNENPFYSVRWKSYEAGWFNSSGIIELGLSDSLVSSFASLDADMADIFVFAFHVDQQNGPILTENGFGIGMVDVAVQPMAEFTENIKQIVSWDQSKPFYEFKGRMGFAGTFTYEDNIPEISVLDDDGTPIMRFADYQSTGTASNSGVTAVGAFGGLEFGSAADQIPAVSVKDVSYKMDIDTNILDIISGALYQGSGEFLLDKIAFDDPSSSVEMNDLAISFESTLNDQSESADVLVRYQIGQFLNNGKAELSNMIADIELKNYGAEFHDLYMNMYAEMFETILTVDEESGGEPDVEKMPQELQQKIMTELLPALVKTGPEIHINDLSFTMPEGQFKSSAKVQLAPITADPIPMMDPGFWLSKLTADAAVRANIPLVHKIAKSVIEDQMRASAPEETTPEELSQFAEQQVAPTLQALVQQGMLVAQDDQYQFDFKFADGVAELNGNTIPLPFVIPEESASEE